MIKKFCLLILFGNFFIHFAQALPNPTLDPRVQKIYDARQEKLIWVQNGQWSSCAKTLLETISHVDQEGLWQENYTPFLEALHKADLSSLEQAKEADGLLTLAALNYISDMKGERLKPHSSTKDNNLKQPSHDESEVLLNFLSLPDQCGWIHTLAPKSPEYQHLKALLASYQGKSTSKPLPKGTTLQKGDQGPLVEILRAQLIAQGALSSQNQQSDIFDDELEMAVKNYQKLHGLNPDGIVGNATANALNPSTSPSIPFSSIIVNLERHRQYNLPSRYIQVNIPNFTLTAVQGGLPAFLMPIITGKEHTKTPLFNAPMTAIIFNPSWHVPPSIMRELLPKIQANPSAFAAKGYRISQGGGGTRIVQSPGPGNSLGKIRFTLDSPFSIYLHGTPQRSLFKKSKRAFSHGCIRVQDPEKLAAFVLNDPEKWSLDRIKKEASGTRTKHVKLEHPVPVFITYFTIVENEKNQVNFVGDPYGQDKRLFQALEALKGKKN